MLCCIWKEKRLNKGRKSSVSSPNRSLVLGLGWPQCHNQHERAPPCRWRLLSAADEHLVSSGAGNQAGAVPHQCPDAFPLPSAYCGTSWGGWRLTLVTSSCALGSRQRGQEQLCAAWRCREPARLSSRSKPGSLTVLQGAFEVGPSVNSDESGEPSSEIRNNSCPLLQRRQNSAPVGRGRVPG